jgi:hypothetical protein
MQLGVVSEKSENLIVFSKDKQEILEILLLLYSQGNWVASKKGFKPCKKRILLFQNRKLKP